MCLRESPLPPELLYISVYVDDDEAFDIWTKRLGVDPSHMVRFGKEVSEVSLEKLLKKN